MSDNHLGPYQQGQEVPLWLQCTDADGLPVAPDAAPQADVYSPAGLEAGSLKLGALEGGVVTGLFFARLFLGGGFPEGNYTVCYRWGASGAQRGARAAFTVGPGGGPTGQVVALGWYPRPHANFLVNQRSSDSIHTGKNPRP